MTQPQLQVLLEILAQSLAAAAGKAVDDVPGDVFKAMSSEGLKLLWDVCGTMSAPEIDQFIIKHGLDPHRDAVYGTAFKISCPLLGDLDGIDLERDLGIFRKRNAFYDPGDHL